MVQGNPPGYGQYIARHRDETSSQHLTGVKFATRYRFAGQLDAVSAHGYRELTSKIYSEALRVGLAYSAFEQLLKLPTLKGVAAVRLPKSMSVFRSDACEKFRKLLVEGSEGSLKDQLIGLVASGQNQDVLPVIRATRHAMFHGALSPGSMGFSSAKGLRFLESLSQGLFVEMDRLFAIYLNQINQTSASEDA